MTSDTYKIIRKAIQNKEIVTAIYQDHPREMCPHVIGHKNGREQALFYQFGGSTSKGPVVPGSNQKQNWRCIPIAGLINVSTRSGEWHTSDNHSQAQTCVDEIDLEVDL